jgi:hypothetical protein
MPVPLDTDAIVDELLSCGRTRAPANEPAVPPGMAVAERQVKELRERRVADANNDADLLRVLDNHSRHYRSAIGNALSTPPPASSPSLERLSNMDEQALRYLQSPNPRNPTAAAERPMLVGLRGSEWPEAPRSNAADSGRRVASASVDDVLEKWKRLDRLSMQMLNADWDELGL